MDSYLRGVEFIDQLACDRPDLDRGYILQCLICERSYFENYADVAVSGMAAAEHFFSYGFRERRVFKSPGVRRESNDVVNKSSKAIFFFSNANSTDGSFIYRCVYQSGGYPNTLVYNGTTEIKKLVRGLFNSHTLIFSRPERNDLSRYIIELAKNIGLKVVLDYDDLLMPEYVESLGYVRSVRDSNIESVRANLINKASFLLYADSFICSTHNIAKCLELLGKPVKVMPNKIPAMKLSDERIILDRAVSRKSRRVKILYLSGTATHGRDYSIINGVMVKLAQEFADCFDITFLGSTGAVHAPLLQLKGRVGVLSRLTFDEMLRVISEHDVALVPLEETVFNDAKSNIKFIECGSQGVPVLASPRSAFKDVIVNNKNGWLCRGQIEWYETLVKIIKKPSILDKPSMKAWRAVQKNHTILE